MQALAGLAGNLPNSVNLAVDSFNRFLDRKAVDDRISRREKSFTDAGLPTFLAHQGTNSDSDGFRPPSVYSSYGPRTFLRTGIGNNSYTGPNNVGWFNSRTIGPTSTSSPSPTQVGQNQQEDSFYDRLRQPAFDHLLTPWQASQSRRLEAYHANRSNPSNDSDRGSFL